MQYSATVPKHVINQLPETMKDADTISIFSVIYKQVTGSACVDMEDIHPQDDSYYTAALYATLMQLHAKTGNDELLNAAEAIRQNAYEVADLEGIPLDEIAQSRVYYVAAQVFPNAISAGLYPESKPIALPYCNTYKQAQNLLQVIKPEQKLKPSSQYGSNGEKLPVLPTVQAIYTVWAPPTRIAMLNQSIGRDIVDMVPYHPINPKTIAQAAFIIPQDILHEQKTIIENVSYESRPVHDAIQREMNMRMDAIFALQDALSKTPVAERKTIDMQNESYQELYAIHGFMRKPPFGLTLAERMMQLTERDLCAVCNAATLAHVKPFREAFLQEFGNVYSFKELTNGLRKHLQELSEIASKGDVEHIQSIASSAGTMALIMGSERAEAALSGEAALNIAQIDYLKFVRNYIPERLKDEFTLRAVEQIKAGFNVEAAAKSTCIAMAREASNQNNVELQNQLTHIGEQAELQYKIHQAEQEELGEYDEDMRSEII